MAPEDDQMSVCANGLCRMFLLILSGDINYGILNAKLMTSWTTLIYQIKSSQGLETFPKCRHTL